MSGIKQSAFSRYLPSALALVTASVAIVWLAIGSRDDYERELHQGEQQTQLLATSLQDTAERHFNEINGEVVAIRQVLEQRLAASRPTPLNARDDVVRVIDDDRDILRVAISVNGAQAFDILTTETEDAAVDLSAIAWPGAPVVFPFGTVEIGAPIALSSGAHTVPLRYAFTAAKDLRAMEIVALTDTEQLLLGYQSLDLATGSAIAVFRRDGLLLARWPNQPSYVGQTFRGPIFGHHLNLAEAATIRAMIETDDHERILSYRTVRSWPLVVVAGAPVRGLLESWWSTLPGKLLLLALLLSAILLLWVALQTSQTALRRSVEDLTLSEGRLARLLANIPGGVYTRRFIPPDRFDYPFISPGFRKIFGLPPDAPVPGMDMLLPFVHPDDRESAAAAVLASTKGDEFWSREFRIVRPDGQLAWVQSRARRYRNDLGEILWDGIVIDVSNLRRHEKLLEQVQQVAGLGYWLWFPVDGNLLVEDSQRHTIYSSAFAQIMGVPPEALNISDEEFGRRYVHPEDRERGLANYRKFLASDRLTHEAEYRILRSDGTVRWFHETLSKEIVAGSVNMVVGVIREVTDVKAREAQLVHAQKMEAIGELTGGVAHDFNNLLTVVIGNLEAMLERLPKDAPLVEFAQAALSASDRGATLTKRLLAFARRQPLSPQPIDVERLLRDLMPLLKRSLGELVQVLIEAEPDLPRALVDPHQFENAIINLANNARDAMPRGGRLSIHIDATKTAGDAAAEAAPDIDDAGPFLRITVSDTGAGMAAEALERAVEPFFTTKPLGQGTGLGLSMVYGLVKQSHGHMKIYSEPGVGTTVLLYLPQATQGPTDLARGSINLANFTGSRALLVDDDQPVRATTAAMLRSLGFNVVEAASGKEAMRVLEGASPIDVLITDVMLAGGMLGPDIAARARALRPEMKVLFISGFAADTTMEARPLLGKPFRRAELAAELAKILRA